MKKSLKPINDTVEKIPEKIIDRIGSIEQKEEALAAGDLRRADVIRAIKEGLVAMEEDEELLNGKTVKTYRPATALRLKAAELACKMFGDLKEFERVGNTTINRITYQWLNAPNANVVATRVGDGS